MYADPEIFEGRRRGVPMGSVGSGEDVTGVAVFLASQDARYTTGSVVGADGGQAVGYFLSVPGRRFSGGRMDSAVPEYDIQTEPGGNDEEILRHAAVPERFGRRVIRPGANQKA